MLWITTLVSLTTCLSLGSATRLTYHEAFIAQGAREILASGNWWYPAIGEQPWLEKPPLPFWLVAGLGWWTGSVSPYVARLPSAVAAFVMVIGTALLATRYYGPSIGMLSGAIQTTTAWTVLRSRLAEADMLLVCLVVWALVAFDRLRQGYCPSWPRWRWVFFVILSATTLVKGTGFGAALVLSVVITVLAWDRDRRAWDRLVFPAGWSLITVSALAWPVVMVAQHGFRVINLWALHITERLDGSGGHGPFAGESWLVYVANILGQALPWTPLAIIGAWAGFRSALRNDATLPADTRATDKLRDPGRGIRLLYAWALMPLILVSIASARRSHYAIYALVPWSVWAALGLSRVGSCLIERGWHPKRLRRLTWSLLTGLATAYGVCFWLAGPWFNQRSTEWAFYERIGQGLPVDECLVLLYDDWDREPYPTPFAPIPHDLAVRLYYLNRPACWHFDVHSLGDEHREQCPLRRSHDRHSPFLVIARDRDQPALAALGQVEILARSPAVRWDRAYFLARVQPGTSAILSAQAFHE